MTYFCENSKLFTKEIDTSASDGIINSTVIVIIGKVITSTFYGIVNIRMVIAYRGLSIRNENFR